MVVSAYASLSRHGCAARISTEGGGTAEIQSSNGYFPRKTDCIVFCFGG